MSSTTAWLQLLRVSALPTVWANVLMAYGLGHAGWLPLGPLAACLAASTCLYWAGMVFNDVADLHVDQRERPERPLPSGRIGVAAARRAGWGLLFAGGLAALLAAYTAYGAPPQPAWGLVLGSAGGLMALVLSYNFWLKPTWLGPLNMGLCRGVNLLFVFSTASNSTGWLGIAAVEWAVAATVTIYVTGVTCLARHEATARRSPAAQVGLSLMASGAVAYAGCCGWLAARSGIWTTGPSHGLVVLGMVCVAAAVALVPGSRAVAAASPSQVQRGVKWGLFALPLFDAILCFVAGGGAWVPFLVVLGLAGGGIQLARAIRPT